MWVQISAVFFGIGLFAFGGGYVVLSFLQQEAVRRGWMSAEQFVDFIAISQCTPGPIAINMATFTGFQIGGIPGAVGASIAVSLPGMLLMLLLARFFFHAYEYPAVQAAFRGIRPVIAGLVAGVAWHIGEVAVQDWITAGIAGVAVVLLIRWHIHPLLLIAGSAVAGILFL